MSIIQLPSNRPPDRFYRGGQRLAELRDDPRVGEYEPEDWVGSVTTVWGESRTGLTQLPDGNLLVDAVAAEPEWWLGPNHMARYGADPMLLVKLLDAGQRLPVHAHPDRVFAREHLARTHGKTEAWYLLSGGSVHLGLQADLGREELAGVLERQDEEEILSLMHHVDVEAGDVVFVPAGVLHAIGEGLLLVELQEPEDLSIMLEWQGFPIDGPRDGHLGLGYDVAIGAMERCGRTADEVAELVRPAKFGGSILPAEASPYFRLGREQVNGMTEIEPGFAVLVVLDGRLQVTGTQGSIDLSRGATAVAPHGAGPLTLAGTGELLVCRPPTA